MCNAMYILSCPVNPELAFLQMKLFTQGYHFQNMHNCIKKVLEPLLTLRHWYSFSTPLSTSVKQGKTGKYTCGCTMEKLFI